MSTSVLQLERWFKEGLDDVRHPTPNTHMVIVCDTFDWEDYPIYVKENEDVREIAAQYDNKGFSKLMEVYDLRLDMAMQMAEHRAWHW